MARNKKGKPGKKPNIPNKPQLLQKLDNSKPTAQVNPYIVNEVPTSARLLVDELDDFMLKPDSMVTIHAHFEVYCPTANFHQEMKQEPFDEILAL